MRHLQRRFRERILGAHDEDDAPCIRLTRMRSVTVAGVCQQFGWTHRDAQSRGAGGSACNSCEYHHACESATRTQPSNSTRNGGPK